MICAVEPSADALGAALILAMQGLRPQLRFIGCGGAAMQDAGLTSLFSIKPFSVIGPVGAARALPAAMQASRTLARAAKEADVTSAVFIDAWAFSYLAAKRLRQDRPDIKLFKYVAPQVWASRAHRAKLLAEKFDGLLTLFQFENAYFDGLDIDVKWVGHGGFQNAAGQSPDVSAFRERYNLSDGPVLAALFGSRTGEIKTLAPIFLEVLSQIHARHPDVKIVSAPAPSVRAELRRLLENSGVPIAMVEPIDKQALFATADVALAASGTVTTELAIHATPMVVGYKIDPLSAAWAKRVLTVDYLSLINIASTRLIIPEFVQENCRPEPILGALETLLKSQSARARQTAAFKDVLASAFSIGGPPAADIAAETLLGWGIDRP